MESVASTAISTDRGHWWWWFSYGGRDCRTTYLLMWIGSALAALAMTLVVAVPLAMASYNAAQYALGPGVLVWLYLACATGVRRLHDTGHSGWMILLLVVPVIGIGLACYMLFRGGNRGPNRYGYQAN